MAGHGKVIDFHESAWRKSERMQEEPGNKIFRVFDECDVTIGFYEAQDEFQACEAAAIEQKLNPYEIYAEVTV